MQLQGKLFNIVLFVLIISVFTSCSTLDRLEKLQQDYQGIAPLMQEIGVDSYASTIPVYYHTGAQWNARSLELIEEAQNYILVSTFLGVEHESTEAVWQALAKKAKEGVRVYVIIDSSSNFQLVPFTDIRIKAAFMYLRDLGLEVVEYNSLTMSNLFFLPSLLDRDHRKYWIVDGEMLAVGGINVNHSSLDYPTGIGNIDTMAEIVSAGATREVVDSFIDTWNRYSTTQLKGQDFPVSRAIDLHAEQTSVWVLDHHWPADSTISTMFDLFSLYAENELWLVQGYTFLTPGLLDRIRYSVDRGVSVNIILSENSTQPKYEMASRYGVLDLLDAGANVYMYNSPEGAFLHLKLMVADDRLVTIGSANYNLRSQTLSRELNLLFEDERVANQSVTYIQSLLDDCRMVTRQEALSYRNLKSWYFYLLMQVWG